LYLYEPFLLKIHLPKSLSCKYS